MSWKSFLRSSIALSRAIEKESNRQDKIRQKERMYNKKMEEQERARFEVEEYEEFIYRIRSFHKDIYETIDWNKLINLDIPLEPSIIIENSKTIEEKIKNYKPSFFERLFNKEEIIKNEMELELKLARNNEELKLKDDLLKWRKEVSDTQEIIEIARGIQTKNLIAYKKAFDEMNTLSELSDLANEFFIDFKSSEKAKTSIVVKDLNILPKIEKSLTKTGKLSTKELSNNKRVDIYQDYICSVALRVGREVFSILPLEYVLLNLKSYILNPINGYLEIETILSVNFVKKTLMSLNFDEIDPSDSMKNFICNMNIKKNLGVIPVDELDL
jgi:hypothetical protein